MQLRTITLLAASFTFLALTSANLSAQGTKTAAAAAGPDMTTERFGDWIVVCSGQPRVCESGQSIATENQVTVARVAVGRPSKDKPQSLVIVVPNNITIASGLKITADAAKPPISIAFKTCTANGCFATIDLTPELIKDFKSQQGAGQISFESAANQKVNFQYSLRGFDQAYDALASKEK